MSSFCFKGICRFYEVLDAKTGVICLLDYVLRPSDFFLLIPMRSVHEWREKPEYPEKSSDVWQEN